ncbi:hypothetical protein OAO88_03275 [Candidatus Pelagibacter sp.]|nr:hypothetical protein [Candidatus Pelagibacter sp.]
MKEGIQQIVDRFNDIYLSKGIRSLPPIKLYFSDENYEKTFDDNNYKVHHDAEKTRICTVEFFLKHKILEWNLFYLYGHERGYEKEKEFSFTTINELKSYVKTSGINVADDERVTTRFETLREGSEFIKSQIIKTYENFQNL